MTLEDFFAKIDAEGGVWETLLVYGLDPEGIEDLEDWEWRGLVEAVSRLRDVADDVDGWLDELAEKYGISLE